MEKVLIVDDQMAIRTLISEVLKEDFELRFASTGEEAIKVAGNFKPDIVLLDIGLGGMNGIEALPKIVDLVPESSIIMLTGNIDDMLINKALALGACDYIAKPFDILKMREKLIGLKLQKTAI